MLPNKIFEFRESKFSELSELTADNILSENTASKVKKRKNQLFQKIMLFRRNVLTNFNHDKPYTNSIPMDFKEILNLIPNNDERIYLINYIFLNDTQNVNRIISKYQNQANFNIDYNQLSSSKYLLDIIETNNYILKIIIQNKSNINYLINKINLMSNQQIPYDHNYIMIYSYFLISDENVDHLLKKEINNNNIFELIIKNETEISYIYLFFIYSYIYHFNNQQIEQSDNILDSLFSIIKSKKNCKNDNLLWEIYNLLTFFSKIPKFIYKFYDNFDYIFVKREFYEKDIITIEKLKIVYNIFNNLNNEGINHFLKKDTGNILNLILFTLNILAKIDNNCNNIKGKKMALFLESVKILEIITSYKDLTYILLENKRCLNLILKAFENLVLINNEDNNLLLNEICYNIFITVKNIIIFEHKIFIRRFKGEKLHKNIKNKFEYYIKNNFIKEEIFLPLMDILILLYENDKKDIFQKETFKMDFDSVNLYDSILNIGLKFYNYGNIHNKCYAFIGNYYQNK